MGFTNLPQTIQDLYLANLELGLKVVLIIFLAFICIRQIKKLKDNEKTPYLLVAQIRAIMGFVSYGILAIIPFISLFIFYPQFKFETIQLFAMRFYFIAMFVFTIIFILNMFFFTPMFIMKLVGYDANSDRTNQIMNQVNKFMGDFKFKKNQFLNKIMRKT